MNPSHQYRWWIVSSPLWQFSIWGRNPQYPLDRRLGRPQSLSDIFASAKNRVLVIQPIVSSFYDGSQYRISVLCLHCHWYCFQVKCVHSWHYYAQLNGRKRKCDSLLLLTATNYLFWVRSGDGPKICMEECFITLLPVDNEVIKHQHWAVLQCTGRYTLWIIASSGGILRFLHVCVKGVWEKGAEEDIWA
jgi:hypothetical protein